jgi:hypothetical protein
MSIWLIVLRIINATNSRGSSLARIACPPINIWYNWPERTAFVGLSEPSVCVLADVLNSEATYLD